MCISHIPAYSIGLFSLGKLVNVISLVFCTHRSVGRLICSEDCEIDTSSCQPLAVSIILYY